MVPSQLQKLHAVTDSIHAMTRQGATAETIVQRLIADHGATRRCRPSGNILRVGGIASSCTWSQDQGLIDGWRRLATRRILQLQGQSE